MANLIVEVLSGELGYSIRVNGEVSEEVEYGEPVELKVGGVLYVGYADTDESGAMCTPFDEFVMEAKPLKTKTVWVDGKGGESDEGDVEDGEKGDDADEEDDEEGDEPESDLPEAE